MNKINTKHGMASTAIIAIASAIVIAGTVYVITSNNGTQSSSTNPSATDISVSKNSENLIAKYSKNCDISRITKASVTVKTADGKTNNSNMEGQVLDMAKSTFCMTDTVKGYQTFIDMSGANTDGKWFVVRGETGYDIAINIKEGVDNGRQILTIEQRSQIPDSQIQLSVFKILKDNMLLSESAVIIFKGTDTQTSRDYRSIFEDKSLVIKGVMNAYNYQ